ncbi:GNAT family N-acetyltransferase [Flavobacterium flavipallidum]|uniref:GNAT family N-acetyltransferase n=1 Tax=Flavobacterium flavipallidum TaxID=3139140 RepID=A0ABU9HJ05_9FLAO
MISNYNIKLRFVEEKDAAFILELRTDLSKSRFISQTDSDTEKQKEWIKNYKLREEKGEEFYFIASDVNEIDFATYRIYNKKEDTIEIGSFISRPSYNNPINVIKLDIIIKEYVFTVLGYQKLNFEVRKDNKSVVNYHKKFNPVIVNEDELNYYFVLEKEAFFESKIKFQSFLSK